MAFCVFFVLFFTPLLGLLNQVYPSNKHKKERKNPSKIHCFGICKHYLILSFLLPIVDDHPIDNFLSKLSKDRYLRIIMRTLDRIELS